MGKRYKKPPVKADQRRDWLRRSEMGESVPKIADSGDFDVRTVRKHIELAKQEREMKEARAAVLRNALERHYDDLRSYAEMLNSWWISGVNVEPIQDSNFIEAALREHLPRSPIWSYISKLRSLNQKRSDLPQKIKSLIQEAVRTDARLMPIVSAGLDTVTVGIVQALISQASLWSQGNKGLSLKDDLIIEAPEERFVRCHYGIFEIARMDIEHSQEYVRIIRQVLEDLESHLREWEEYRDLEKTIAEITRVTSKLGEELAIIRLRRIVPGHCKYCPL